MNAICLLIAGVVHSSLTGQAFTLLWEHSVEKTRWEERYRIVGDRLELIEARVQGLGAGMEPAANAIMDQGWWKWKPERERLSELQLRFSTYAADYRICWPERCAALGSLLDGSLVNGDIVELRPCAARVAQQGAQR